MDRRRLIPIFATVFTNILGAGVILPILPLYAEGQFGASAFQATLLGAAFFGAQFVAAPILGSLSDRVGRRPVLIVSQVGTVFSFVLFVFAHQLGPSFDGAGNIIGIGGGLVVLFMARILDGITGGNISTAQAYISDISTEENRAQALGLISAAFGMGFIFGPAFGGFLAELSLTAPFIGAAIITSGSVLLTIFLLEESLPPSERGEQQESVVSQVSNRELLQNHTILLILIVSFTIILAFSALQSTLALFADRILYPEMPESRVARNVGLILTFVGVIAVITQMWLIKPLVTRLGEQRLVLVGQISLFIALLGTGLSSSAVLVGFFVGILAFGQGVNQPSLQSLITRFGTGRTRGRLLGLFQSANSLALILGPIWAGYVFEVFGPRVPYLVGAALMLVAFVLALLLNNRRMPQQAPVAAD